MADEVLPNRSEHETKSVDAVVINPEAPTVDFSDQLKENAADLDHEQQQEVSDSIASFVTAQKNIDVKKAAAAPTISDPNKTYIATDLTRSEYKQGKALAPDQGLRWKTTYLGRQVKQVLNGELKFAA